MKFVRQRIAGILLIFGLLLAWAGLTSLVIRQMVLIPMHATAYATKVLADPTTRSALANEIATSLQKSSPILQSTPTAQLRSAADQFLSSPVGAKEFATVALQIQQHILGIQTGPIVIGGPEFSSTLAKLLAAGNPTAQALISKAPLSYTIASTTIPSLGKYYNLLGKIISFSLIGSAILLISSLSISTKKRPILRKIGLWFIGFSIFEVALIWALPKYILPHFASGAFAFLTALVQLSTSAVEPIYLSAFGAGLVLTVISFLV